MRTTLTLDNDLLEQVKSISKKEKKSFKMVMNQVLRAGLASFKRLNTKKFRTKARPMGLVRGFSIDNISELLSELDQDE